MSKKLIIGITFEGSVNLLAGQLAHFKQLGYETYLLGPYSERAARFCEKEGCEHLVIDIQREIAPIADFKTLVKIIKIFRKVKPDIINLGTPKVSLLGMIAGYLTGVKKRIYTCRGFRFEHEKGIKRKVLIFMEKITSLLAHKVICISNSVMELGLKNNIVRKDKTIIIHKGSSNGINLELFNPEIETYQTIKSEIIKKHKLNDALVFGFLGRIVDRKGINELIEVFMNIYDSNPNSRLLIVGPFEMTQIRDKSIVEKINNHPGILNYGKIKQEDVPALMLTMDVFVLPAWWEGFGNVLVQAAAMGIPVISTTGTGTVDAVSNEYNGILVPVKNKEKLQLAMLDLMENQQKRKTFAENGKLWAQNFDRQLIWSGIDNFYKQ